MNESFWNNKRPSGVGNHIKADQYPNALTVINNFLVEHSDQNAFTSIGHTLSFTEIDKYSQLFATYLQNFTSLKPNDRIAIQLPNLLQYPITVYGAIRAGLIIVNTNPLYTAREMLHQFTDSQVKALIFLDNFGDMVEKVVSETSIEYLIVTRFADMLPTPKRQIFNFVGRYIKRMVPKFNLPHAVPLMTALKQAQNKTYQQPPNTKSSNPLILQYTGGTTGEAKGAVLTHRNLIANMLQAESMLSQHNKQGHRVFQSGDEILIAPLPLYHIYAFTVHLFCMPFMGNHSILIPNPRDTTAFIKTIKSWKFSAFIGLNTLFTSLLNHPKFKNCDFSALKLTLSGGAALQKTTGKKWHKVTGCLVSEAYGLTECSPAVCMNPSGRLSQLGTVGLPLPSTALKIIDKQGNELPVGEPGELCVKGPQVMSEYWQKPEATKKIIDNEHWLKTGDVGIIQEDGYVRIVDRIKDVILVSGFNVYPNEIEDVVAKHPGILLCAAIGIPDKKTGEAVKLFATRVDNNLTEKELITWCKEYLAAYKVPKYITFREQLPTTSVGKILRKELRKENRPIIVK